MWKLMTKFFDTQQEQFIEEIIIEFYLSTTTKRSLHTLSRSLSRSTKIFVMNCDTSLHNQMELLQAQKKTMKKNKKSTKENNIIFVTLLKFSVTIHLFLWMIFKFQNVVTFVISLFTSFST
jgi:hypothetical protein